MIKEHLKLFTGQMCTNMYLEFCSKWVKVWWICEVSARVTHVLKIEDVRFPPFLAIDIYS